MTRDLVGQVCALLSAISWAGALILLKLSGERVTPLALNLFKNTVALLLLTLTLVVTFDSPSILGDFETSDILLLLFSGVLGIALADTAFLHALNLLGVGRMSIVECLYCPLVLMFSLWILPERLLPTDYLGAGLIVLAVFHSSRHTSSASDQPGSVLAGYLFGALAMALMAFGIVIAKPVLDVQQFPLMWATTIRLVGGTVTLAVLAWASPSRGRIFRVFKPSPVWKYSIPGSILGTYFALIFWIAGFKYTKAALAAALNQTASIFAIILATLVLKEAFTQRKFVAVTLAIAGVMIVTLPHR